MFFARVFFFPHSRASKEEEENCISRFAPIRGTRVSWMRRSFHSSFCFLLPFFLLERYKMIFVSRKSEMADEWKDAFGKERTKGVRVHRGVLTRAGEFLSFFFFLGDSVSYRFLEKSTLSETLCLGELILFFQTNKSQLCSRPWVLASWW